VTKIFPEKIWKRGLTPFLKKKFSRNFSKIQPLMNTKGKSQYNRREGLILHRVLPINKICPTCGDTSFLSSL
jgi:hypothetical protein